MEAADVLDEGYNFCVDNWYSSPTLFHWLQGKKPNSCGTVRSNRKGMLRDFSQKLKPDGMERRTAGAGLICIKWLGKKAIPILNNNPHVNDGGDREGKS